MEIGLSTLSMVTSKVQYSIVLVYFCTLAKVWWGIFDIGIIPPPLKGHIVQESLAPIQPKLHTTYTRRTSNSLLDPEQNSK